MNIVKGKEVETEMSLESSLLGFCVLNENILFVKNHGILLRDDEEFKANSHRVALISGGGSGHEPGHDGFIGEGMLSAAVCGNVFTSPTVTRFEVTVNTFQKQSFIELLHEFQLPSCNLDGR